MAYVGERALRTSGCIVIPRIPSTAMVANQTSMIGPNSRPSEPVPRRWTANSATMITRVIGITQPSIEDEIVSVPSTAESTEIAGVIMLSPKNSAAPNTPRPASTNFRRAGKLLPELADLRDQRHDPALALVVGPHHQADVLDGDDQRHRPEDQGDDAVDAVQRRLDGMRVTRVEGGLDRVDRAGADVAEHDAQRGDPERRLARGARCVGLHPRSLSPCQRAGARQMRSPAAHSSVGLRPARAATRSEASCPGAMFAVGSSPLRCAQATRACATALP